jgi:hypothetical protein
VPKVPGRGRERPRESFDVVTFVGSVLSNTASQFEPVDHIEMALKPWIGTTFVKKGFDLIHRASTSVPPGVAPSLATSRAIDLRHRARRGQPKVWGRPQN